MFRLDNSSTINYSVALLIHNSLPVSPHTHPDNLTNTFTVAVDIHTHIGPITVFSHYNYTRVSILNIDLLLYASSLPHAMFLGDSNVRSFLLHDNPTNSNGTNLENALLDLFTYPHPQRQPYMYSGRRESFTSHILITESLI